MQTLFKKTFLKPLPKGATVKTIRGKLVAKWIGKGGKERTAPVETKADGSQVVRLERKTWVARYRDADNIIRERSTGCTTKAAANVKVTEFVKEAERIAAGVVTKEESQLADWRHSSLADAITDYGEYLTGRKTATKRVKFTKGYLAEGAAACQWTTLGQLEPDRLRRHLDELNADTKDADGETVKGKGAGALNERVTAWVAFGAWLAGKRIRGKRANWNGQKRLGKNPFDGFGKYDNQADCRRERRALTEGELRRLFAATAERPLNEARTVRRGPHKGKLIANVKPETEARLRRLGRERVLIYKTLALTGLRKGELASITVGQCVLDVDRPYIDLNAADEKNGDGNDIPLRGDLAAELRVWIADQDSEPADVIKLDGAGNDRSQRQLFTVPDGLVRILNRDLKAAGIPKKDGRGRTIDVHALRHSFGTLLSTSGVAPRIAQRAMRHSRIDLTMNTYTDPALLDVHAAMNALPSLDAVAELSTEQKATGTDDSQVVGLVGLVGRNQLDLSKVSSLKQRSEAENASLLVSPMVSPRSCPNETIQDNSGGFDDSHVKDTKTKKPRVTKGYTGNSEWTILDLNQRPPRCQRERSLSSGHGKTRDGTTADSLVSPMVSPSEQDTDALTAELLALWHRLDDEQRRELLADFRTRFTGGGG